MQGSLAATSDQITWVLTSYIVAAAIMTAPVGWLAARFGRKNLFITCLVGFTIASMLCGVAQSLTQMVLFRLLQGVFGAALVPLSQATMLDIYPPEQRGSAMAMWGMGVMVGPILGPTLGGYLTELYNWRWVFYVNLPFGILATLGMMYFLPKSRIQSDLKFDWFGFGVLALGLGAFQLMLDRGETKDWFGSTEIIVEAVLAGIGIYLFLVHLFTSEKPFITPAIFKDRNFAASLLVMFAVGMVLLATSALMAPWLQNLANYPVEMAGLIMAPRGLGTMAAMLVAGRLSSRVDPRKLMAVGIGLLGYSLWGQTAWTPDVSEWEMILNTVIQGAGLGFVFIPLAGHRLRDAADGAAHGRHGAAQSVPQHRQRDRRLDHLHAARAQHADRARRADGARGHAVQPRASGRAVRAADPQPDPPAAERAGCGARRDHADGTDAQPAERAGAVPRHAHQPAGATHRLPGRLQVHASGDGADGAAAVPDEAAQDRRGSRPGARGDGVMAAAFGRYCKLCRHARPREQVRELDVTIGE